MKEYSEKLKLANPPESPYRYQEILQVDAEGRVLYLIHGNHDHFDNPNWTRRDAYTFYEIVLWVIIDKNGTYDKENGVLVMFSKANSLAQSYIYNAEDILAFKEKNNWKNDYWS